MTESADFVASMAGKNPEEVYRLMVAAVHADGGNAQAWSLLGHALGEMGLGEASAAAYRRVLESAPDDGLRARTLCNLGLRCHHLGRTDEARTRVEEAIHGDPEMAFAWTNLSMIDTVEGNHEGAVGKATNGFNLGPSPVTELGLAFSLLFAGRYADGLRHFEARFPYKLTSFEHYPYPRWDGNHVNRLFIAAEQGLGDTLGFARFVALAAARVETTILVVQPELVSLLKAMLPGVVVMPQPAIYPIANAWCPLMSLPTAMTMSDAEIVAAAQPRVPTLREPEGWLGSSGRLRVGICWAGSPTNDIDKWRSIPFVDMLELAGVPGVDLYSFQVGTRVSDLHSAGGAGLVRDLSPWIRDASDAAAMLRRMDLVITAETFLGHLAATLGKECWTLCSWHGLDWRHPRHLKAPLWAPQTRIFRQGPTATWRPVIDDVKMTLKEKVDVRTARF